MSSTEETMTNVAVSSPETIWLVQLFLMIAVLPMTCLYLTSNRFSNKAQDETKSAKTSQAEKRTATNAEPSSEQQKDEAAIKSIIIPLEDFEWKTTEPLQLRPFKPKYHLTMALENASVNELVEMDNTYLDRLSIRRKIIEEHTQTVLAATPRVKPAVDELYTWMTTTYLPTRFPTMFSTSTIPSSPTPSLHNITTNETIPLAPSADPTISLRNLGRHTDLDFLLLLPSPDADGYTLEGYISCFPNGFDTFTKLRQKLRIIHAPVPRYADKLEKSMDRFFDRIEVGRYVKRANWTVTTNPELFAAFGNHLYEGETAEVEEVEPDRAWVRCEAQMLHRLPGTRALVFSFKTYMYPLRAIKEEGSGEQLAQAIEGMETGSVPEIYEYKRGVAWGESAKAYLRS